VVYPENVEQISKLLKFCNSNKLPVIPYGAGSGFEGGINAIKVHLYIFILNFKNYKQIKKNIKYRVELQSILQSI
jgi:glycolate oxidase